MKAIIPAAGYATRLWPLTKETPKPLIPIHGKPIIEHTIAKILELKEVDHIYVVTNQKFYTHFLEWRNTFSAPVPLKILNDHTTSNENRLGQIGDIQFVISQENLVNDDLLIVAGDNLFNFSFIEANSSFKIHNAILNPLYDAKSLKVAQEQGSVVINEDHKFIEFMEKAPAPKSTMISQGVYFIPKEKIKYFSEYLKEGNSADKMGYFMIWLLKKEPIYGHVYDKKWFDIGWKENLEIAKKEYEEE